MTSTKKDSDVSRHTPPRLGCKSVISPSLKVNVSAEYNRPSEGSAPAIIEVPPDDKPPKGILKRRDFVYREEKKPVPGVTFVGSSPQMVGYVLRQPASVIRATKKKTPSTRFDSEEKELEEQKLQDRIVREILKLKAFELRCISMSERRIIQDKLDGFLTVADKDLEKKRNKLRDKLLHEDVNLLRQLTAESQTRDETILEGKVKEMMQLRKEKEELHEEKVKELLAKYKQSIDYDYRDKVLEQFRKDTTAALLEQIEENKILREKEKATETAFNESFLLDK